MLCDIAYLIGLDAHFLQTRIHCGRLESIVVKLIKGKVKFVIAPPLRTKRRVEGVRTERRETICS
jgi:hypothetical protein